MAKVTNRPNLSADMPELFTEPALLLPDRIVVEPSRLASGLWGEPEGDISGAYCANTFPKVKVFHFEGRMFVNLGASRDNVTAYPLLSSNQVGPGAAKSHSYEGMEVTYQGRKYRLGSEVVFVTRDRTLEEALNLLRHQYALCGQFASGKTYREALEYLLERHQIPQWEKSAIEMELASPDLPQTQAEMLARLQKPANHPIAGLGPPPPSEQLSLDCLFG